MEQRDQLAQAPLADSAPLDVQPKLFAYALKTTHAGDAARPLEEGPFVSGREVRTIGLANEDWH